MPGITLIDKIVPQGSFTGMVDAEQVLGGGDSGTLPDTTIALSNVTQFMSDADFGSSGGEVTLIDLTVPHFADNSIVTASEGLDSSDNDTSLPTTAAVKDYVDLQIGTADELGELNDTTIDSSPADNEILAYDDGTSEWINQTPAEAGVLGLAGGDMTGSITIPTESDITLTDAPTANTDAANKAYVDDQDAAIASDVLIFTNKTFDVEADGNSISNIDVADFKAAAIVTEGEGLSSNDNDTSLPTSAAVIDYVNNTGGVREIDDLGDVNITDYSAGSLIVGDGNSYDQFTIVGDATIKTLYLGEATLEVYKVRDPANANPLFEWTTSGNGQWKITTKTKLPAGGTWQQIPVVGFYELGGTDVTPDNENDLGSGAGSLCWNEDDENLFISLPEAAGS